MLNKIALYTFAVAVAATWILRHYLVEPDALLSALNLKINIGGGEVPLGFVLPAFLFAAIARMLKLHDRVSDLFGIRRRFDVNEILIPLLEKTGNRPTPNTKRRLGEKRDELMGPVFYKYVSSTNPNPAVDRHLIMMALGAWEYFWIAVEADVIAVIVLLTLLLSYAYRPALFTLGFGLLTLPFLRWSYRQAATYARREVDEILRDPSRFSEVQKSLSAI